MDGPQGQFRYNSGIRKRIFEHVKQRRCVVIYAFQSGEKTPGNPHSGGRRRTPCN